VITDDGLPLDAQLPPFSGELGFCHFPVFDRAVIADILPAVARGRSQAVVAAQRILKSAIAVRGSLRSRDYRPRAVAPARLSSKITAVPLVPAGGA
jgi:hypothetical protein